MAKTTTKTCDICGDAQKMKGEHPSFPNMHPLRLTIGLGHSTNHYSGDICAVCSRKLQYSQDEEGKPVNKTDKEVLMEAFTHFVESIAEEVADEAVSAAGG